VQLLLLALCQQQLVLLVLVLMLVGQVVVSLVMLLVKQLQTKVVVLVKLLVIALESLLRHQLREKRGMQVLPLMLAQVKLKVTVMVMVPPELLV
jgi:hypothetical protein